MGHKTPILRGAIMKIKEWCIWKKLVVFPLIPLLFMIALCGRIIISETISEPRIINGQPDDAPRMAASSLLMLMLSVYAGYLICVGIIRRVVLRAGKE
jgi:hypothetical protein